MLDVQSTIQPPTIRWCRRPIVAVLGGPNATNGLWPILGLTFASNIATSGFYGYVGVWAITRLGATPGQVGALLLVNVAQAGFSSYAEGACSDRVGRKPVLVWYLLAQAAAVGGCCLVGDHLLVGFALVVIASTIGTSAWAARTSLVPDLVPSERRSLAFSTVRTANNLAVVVCRALVGALLVLSGWMAVFAALSVLGLASAAHSQTAPANRTNRRGGPRARTAATAAGNPSRQSLSRHAGLHADCARRYSPSTWDFSRS